MMRMMIQIMEKMQSFIEAAPSNVPPTTILTTFIVPSMSANTNTSVEINGNEMPNLLKIGLIEL